MLQDSGSYQKEVSHDFRFKWLQLARTKNVGPRAFIKLINLFGDPATALAELPKITKYVEKSGKVDIASTLSIECEMQETEKFGAQFILSCDKEYPKLLKMTQDYPPVLVVKGRRELLNKPSIAIVGARNASSNGTILTGSIAKELAQYGYIITSGLARGIDAAAHMGSIQYGTIGVIASGINIQYPNENAKLYDMLYKDGLVVTEYPIGASPSAQYFPQRNRLISGVSLGVVIIEAAKKSGTLITARLALDQGREVFSVPGSPLDPRCNGTNNLIKQGAILVESASDIISEMDAIAQKYFNPDINNTCCDKEYDFGHMHCDINTRIKIEETDDELKHFRCVLLSKLSHSPVKLDDMLYALQDSIPSDIINLLLLELKLAGKIEYCFGNSVCLIAQGVYNADEKED